ncbi:MAG TPA: calcium-binding protein, partial [Ornithinibacter sp.]|nr:calcium-binding protein [Ornithinibacter sp.]
MAANSFLLDLNGSVSILKVLNFDAGLRIVVANGGWSFNAFVTLDFFGIASLSGTVALNSRGDFSINISGFLQLGSSSFGLRGDFSFSITSCVRGGALEIAPCSTTPGADGTYVLQLSGSASVKVRAFGITLAGVGLSFSFSVDTATAGPDGRVKIELRVKVTVTILGIDITKTARFTIGYLQFPPPTYLAGNGSGTLRDWGDSDTVLHVNVGDAAQRTARNIGVDDTDESVIIEQVGGTATSATIKVTAFGRSNTYEHVSSIVANFGDGVDSVVIKDTVLVPVTINGGTGDDVITYEGGNAGTGTGTSAAVKLRGGGDNDFVSASGAANVLIEGGTGNDVLVHEGTGTAVINGGDDDDLLVGSSLTDQLFGEAGNDQLEGVASRFDGGAGNDLLTVTIDRADYPAVTLVGDTGTDTLRLTLASTPDTLTISRQSAGALTLALNNTNRTASGFENVFVDGRAGADTVVVSDLGTDSGLSELTIDLGRRVTTSGTRTVSQVIDGVTFSREVPNTTITPDLAGDSITIHGSTSADTFVLTYVTRAGREGTDVQVVRTGAGGDYTVFVGQSVRSEGDALTVSAGAGDDTLDASALGTVGSASTNRIAVTLRGEANDDRLIGTPFDDVLDGGSGNDRVTGGFGLDTFEDAGGTDTLIETFDADIGLYDNLFVVGVVAGNGVDFTSGTVEDLGGIFELAEITGGAGARRFLVGDADTTVAVAGTPRSAQGWTGDATIATLGGDDVVRVELRQATGARIHLTDTTGDDRLEVWGTSQRDDLVVDVTSGRGQVRQVVPGASDLVVIDHLGIERVEIRTLGGGDRVAVRRIDVVHHVEMGEGDDEVAVGTQAAIGFTAATWPNSGGLLDDIDAALVIDGGSGPGSLSGLDILTVDDTGDTAANTGALTATTITGLGMAAAGITYTTFEDVAIALGSGDDTFTVHSTHAGPFRPTSIHTNAGNDTVIVRSVSGPLSVDTGADTDTVRVSSTASGVGGVLTGIDALLTVSGGGGAGDRLFVDDTATTSDVIGVVTDTTVAGLGMTLGGSAARPSPVQVVTVLNAFDGRFTITVAGAGTTAQLDYDASAEKVQAALVALPTIGAGNVVVTKAGGRWTITWVGALAGEAGWPFLVTAVTSVGAYPLSGDPSGPAVVTGFSAMTDGLVAYDGFEVLDLSLGSGDDVVTVDDTLDGSTTVNTGGGDDRVFLEAIGGPTAVNGQAGDDWLTVNAVPDAAGVNPMDGQRLTLDGGAGSDYDIVYLWGVGQSRIDVLDTGYDGGTNVLVVGGPDTDDVFLLRKRLIALLSNRNETTGLYGASEKVTYTDGINGSVIINGNDGDDTFALDDTATIVTINGGSGNDRFRVGQLFTAYTADAEFGIPAAEFFTSTRGSLSNGISFPATINGGTGD